jgi:hypothetical protein
LPLRPEDNQPNPSNTNTMFERSNGRPRQPPVECKTRS